VFGFWVILGLSGGVFAQSRRPADDPSVVLRDYGLAYHLKEVSVPRPLRIHCLRVDLSNHRIEPVALIGPDPDGSGPAEAALQFPETLAKQYDGKILALVNANVFGGLPDANGVRGRNWHVGLPVTIFGLAATGGVIRSEVDPSESVWFDSARRFHVGAPKKGQIVREGVGGFGSVLRDKKVLNAPGGPIDPRTAVGIESDDKHMWMVVVDGRQKGYSEGVTLEELAKIMLELGCRDAVNLDGGGSSIMMMANARGSLEVINSSSGRIKGKMAIRPIPTALAIRKTAESKGSVK